MYADHVQAYYIERAASARTLRGIGVWLALAATISKYEQHYEDTHVGSC